MSDIIKLLSDSIANQIAAGEVIQRPASLVKELIENSIDAQATDIKILVKDAGRTLIQIIDNGKGMSPTDARMAFERHATSKISTAEDLFKIRTMGFRGEALASIAAVASVELKTKREEDDLGTYLKIAASEIISQEPTNCSKGANFIVKNLFYNIPARRKFLKADRTENRNILNEINKIVIANPKISFTLISDDKEILNLKSESLHQRIINLFGKNIGQNLIKVNTDTSIVNIYGFITKPERSQKNTSEQYFYVNNRFMIHPYFRKAVSMAYDKLIPEGKYPSFFLFFDVDPNKIDINIHPTKTEIKFEEENSIFQILNSVIKENLGRFNIAPSLEFDENIMKDIHLTSKTTIRPPTIAFNPDYNPFDPPKASNIHSFKGSRTPKNWESIYSESQKKEDDFFLPEGDSTTSIPLIEDKDEINTQKHVFFQLKNKFILTSCKSGMMLINQKRAHERVLFEKFLELMKTRKGVSQKSLFPVIYEPSQNERAILLEVLTELNSIGFQIQMKGKDKFEINGIPGDLTHIAPKELIEQMIHELEDVSSSAELVLHDKIAISLAKSACFKTGISLKQEEMENLFFKLMSCANQNYTADGKKIIEIISIEEIEKKLN